MAPACFVCGGSSVKYRFPCCRERYCSTACYKAHLDSPCGARRGAAVFEQPVKRQRSQAAAEEEDETEVLTEVQLCALRGHAGVREALRSAEFRHVLTQVDTAEDRRHTLETLLGKDKYFCTFVDHLMEAMERH
eukprot:NODE_20501_length_795_cov_5.287425.p2 GENE.NODE_20501_length_795_cov_5.287425~~NODE_20501_length_795_cov_5.287425.p2  ORF type:complete len:148 (+),score=32.46 NODE_20501_length_795_cov_5.287425:43-444(+)